MLRTFLSTAIAFHRLWTLRDLVSLFLATTTFLGFRTLTGHVTLLENSNKLFILV